MSNIGIEQGDSLFPLRPLRWYLLLWICLGYVWGFLGIWDNQIAVDWATCQRMRETPTFCKQIKQLLVNGSPPSAVAAPQLILPALLLFTLILLFFGLALWMTLSNKIPRRIRWLFLAAQGLLAVAVVFVAPVAGVATPLSLYLALTLEASALFKRTHLFIAALCLALFLLLATRLQWTVMGVTSVGAEMVSAVVLLVVGLLFVMGFLSSYQFLMRAHTQLETAHAQLVLSAERIEALTLLTERQRMARELHDTLAQGLAGIILQLGVADGRLRERQPDMAQEILRQTLVAARDTLANARSAISDLRASDSNSADRLEAAREEIRRFTIATGIPCESELSLLSLVAPAHIEHVQRFLSEGLWNIAQHAQARHAWARVTRQEGELLIEVGDDGVGFAPALAAGQAGHYGLLGLRERARLVGGRLVLLSAPGQGARAQLWTPICEQEELP